MANEEFIKIVSFITPLVKNTQVGQDGKPPNKQTKVIKNEIFPDNMFFLAKYKYLDRETKYV